MRGESLFGRSEMQMNHLDLCTPAGTGELGQVRRPIDGTTLRRIAVLWRGNRE